MMTRRPARGGAVTLVVGLAVMGVMALLAAEVYDAVTEHEGVAGLDRPVLNWFISIRTFDLNRAVTWFTALGSTRILTTLAALAALVLALIRRSWTPILMISVALAGSALMTTIGKAVVGRVRPPSTDAVAPFEHSFSFPSGHTLNTTVTAGIIAYLVAAHRPRRGVLISSVLVAGLFAVAMGLSRVYLGHHWLTDVLVAWALGLSWLALMITGLRLWQLRIPARKAARAPRGMREEGST
jgi:membrane-associated phospholipid phosphatase